MSSCFAFCSSRWTWATQAVAVFTLLVLACVSVVRGQPYRPLGSGLSASFSPDGAKVATARSANEHGNGIIEIRDVASGRVQSTLRMPRPPRGDLFADTSGRMSGSFVFVKYLPDNRIIALGSSYQVIMYRPGETEGVVALKLPDEPDQFVVSGDGRTLVCSRGNTILLYEIASTRIRAKASVKGDAHIEAVAISANGQRLAATTWNKELRIWNLQGKANVSQLPLNDNYKALAFSPDGGTLAAAGEAGVHLWSVTKQEILATLAAETSSALDFSADGKFLICSPNKYEVEKSALEVWDVEKFVSAENQGASKKRSAVARLQRLKPENFDVGERRLAPLKKLPAARLAAFSPQGDYVALLLGDDQYSPTIAMLTSGSFLSHRLDRPIASFGFKADDVMAVSRDGTLAACWQGESVRIWNLDTTALVAELRHDDPGLPKLIAFLSDRNGVITADSYGKAILWDLNTKGSVRVIQPDDMTSAIAWQLSADGRQLFAYVGPTEFRIWNLAEPTGDPRILHVENAPYDPKVFCVSPSAELIAAGGYGEVTVWRVATGEVEAKFKAHVADQTAVHAIAFAPDGSKLAWVSYVKPMEVVDTKSWKRLWQRKGGWSSQPRLAFDDDSKTLLTTCSHGDRIARWDAHTGELLASVDDVQYVSSIVKVPGRPLLLVDAGDVQLWSTHFRNRVSHSPEVKAAEAAAMAEIVTKLGYLGQTVDISMHVSKHQKQFVVSFALPQEALSDATIITGFENEVAEQLIAAGYGPALVVQLCRSDFCIQRTIYAGKEATRSSPYSTSKRAETLASRQAKVRPSSSEIVGAWRLVELWRNGKKESRVRKVSYRFDGNRIFYQVEDKPAKEAQYTVNAGTAPHRLTLRTPNTEKTRLLYFQVRGDQLLLCVAPPGATAPTTLTSKPGDGRTILALERQRTDDAATALGMQTHP